MGFLVSASTLLPVEVLRPGLRIGLVLLLLGTGLIVTLSEVGIRSLGNRADSLIGTPGISLSIALVVFRLAGMWALVGRARGAIVLPSILGLVRSVI